MAKGKRSSKRPQPRHKKNRKRSQFDKRSRLAAKNPKRKKTTRARVPLVGMLAGLVAAMANLLDARIAFRMPIIAAGMMLANGRRVAASWFAAAGVQEDWDRFYDCLISIGKNTQSLAMLLLIEVVHKFKRDPDAPDVFIWDDTTAKRYGKHVEGAGVHHNSTPGPADGEWMYGHSWGSLCYLAKHPLWGAIALPLISRLYVRAKDVPSLAAKYDWKFRTKHELAVESMTWVVNILRSLRDQRPTWFVADGAYAAKTVIKPLMSLGVVVFSRLRKDAVLYELPPERKKGQRGRPLVYSKNRINLAKRAGHRHGWEWITYHCRGSEVTRPYKSFLATSRLTGGVIRVVIVRFEDGWAAYFSTDAQVGVRAILETVADRWAIEEHFHDVKEIWGAGQQQVRNVWSNIGCWHLNQWMYTLVEMCAWDRSKGELTDRGERPWDNPDRRPSHADRRCALTKEMLANEFIKTLPKTPESRKFRKAIEAIIELCA